jgi:hypothetical protein
MHACRDWSVRTALMAVALFAAFAACLSDGQAPVRLSRRADRAQIDAAVSAAAATMGGPVAFPAQSFELTDGERRLGALVSGRGTAGAGSSAGATNVCFAAYVPLRGSPAVQHTVGAGEWEAESCTGLAAVTLLDASARGRMSFGLLYRAESPNATTVEPVVLTLAGGRLLVDTAASRRASVAGATTVPALRRAVRAPR